MKGGDGKGGDGKDGEGKAFERKRYFKVFVGGVPPTCTEEKFKAYFEKWGVVTKSDLRDGKGYGFVTFESEQIMDLVLENREQHIIDGKWIDVKPGEDRPGYVPGQAGSGLSQGGYNGGPL